MATVTVEERLATLEALVATLLAEKAQANSELPWYEQRKGAFADDEMYDRAMDLKLRRPPLPIMPP